jgi:predicted Zn-dependent protease with MMP-like domain
MKGSRLAQMAADVVAQAQRALPKEVREAAKAVAVHFEPTPAADVLADGFEPDLLGLFWGNPAGSDISVDDPAPPRIFLYTANLWDFCEEDAAAFREEVRITYLHELGHYLGWDEDQVAERGLE